MLSYLLWLPEYLKRFLLRTNTLAGIIGGILLFLLSQRVEFISLNIVLLEILTFGILFLEAGYGIFRQERAMRSEREQDVRVTASLGGLSTNSPDPGPGKLRISISVNWEVLASREISTDKLALNLIFVYEKRWWQFWKKTRFPIKGLPPNGGTQQYRKKICANKLFSDEARFEYIGYEEDADPHWILELVLITGMPKAEYRIPVFIDWDEIHSRGTNPPL